MAAPLATELRYRSAMLRRFGPLFFLSGLWWLVRTLRLEEHSAERIRQAAEKGPVVYVLHARSRFDWLALNVVLRKRRLPLARFTHGIQSAWLGSLVEGGRLLWGALQARLRGEALPDPIGSGWFAQAVAQGMPSAIFLVDAEGEDLQSDPIAALVQAQAGCERPIQLVPVVVVWRRNWERARTEVGRLLLGREERPSALQKILAVSTRHRDAFVQAGEPVDLRALLVELARHPDERRVRLCRVLLRRYLYRESRVVRGPRVRSHRWVRRLVLHSPEVRRLVTEEARATGRGEAQIAQQVGRELDRIAARFSWPVVAVSRVLTRFLWNRIYSGMDLREVDVERIRAAYRDGAAVLVPCHRSHLDYVLISSQLFERDVMIPHVIAGDNLSFFPLGALLRRVGAVFIKRSFKGDRIFPVVFAAYLRQLIRDEFPVEFFIEGGRSRTGRLLPPKLGVLSMVVDAAAEVRADRQVSLLPIAISYEKIAEEGAYARELAGERKKAEDLGEVVKAGKVVTQRYGRVFLRVGEPIALQPLLAALPSPWAELDRLSRQELLAHLGERLMHRIASSMVVVPTGLVALALLAQSRRGIRLSALHERAERLDALLAEMGAEGAGRTRRARMDRALARFERAHQLRRLKDEEGDILQVVPERRVTLEYYKNALLHYLVGPALLASAVRGSIPLGERERGQRRAEVEPALSLFRLQIWLLRYDLSLDPDEPVDALWARARAAAARFGALEAGEGEAPLVVDDPARLTELSELVRNHLESVALVLRALRGLRGRVLPAGELPVRIQKVGEGLLAVDELRRPEALSLVNLQHALRALREEGALTTAEPGGELVLDEPVIEHYARAVEAMLA